MAAPKKVDWFQARQDYLEDNRQSYSTIAKKYGVTKTAVEKHATKEGWAKLRRSLGDKAFESFQNKLLNTKSAAQDRHLLHYQNLQALANKSLVAMDQQNFMLDKDGRVVRDKKGVPIQVPPNPFALEKLTKSLKAAIEGERVVLGLPNAVLGHSDATGNDVWTGFPEALAEAEQIVKEKHARQQQERSRTATGGDRG